MSHDDFSDIRGVIAGFGSLGGMGADAHHSAQQSRAADGSGIEYKMHCDNCGAPANVTVTWDEFIYGVARQVPPGWKYSSEHGALYPNVGCPVCRALLMLTLYPDECARHLKAGEQEGRVSAAYIQNALNALRARAQGHRGG